MHFAGPHPEQLWFPPRSPEADHSKIVPKEIQHPPESPRVRKQRPAMGSYIRSHGGTPQKVPPGTSDSSHEVSIPSISIIYYSPDSALAVYLFTNAFAVDSFR